MPIVSAICPSCSAPLEVDNKTEAGVCKFCGNAFITEKAINNFNIKYEVKADNVIISNKPTMEELLEREEVFAKLGETKKLEKLYEEMVQHYPKRYEGWWGKILMYTNHFKNAEASVEQVNKWYSFVKESAPDEVKDTLNKQYCQFLLLKMKQELRNQEAALVDFQKDFENKQAEKVNEINTMNIERNLEISSVLVRLIPAVIAAVLSLVSYLVVDHYWNFEPEDVPKWSYAFLAGVVICPIVAIVMFVKLFKDTEIRFIRTSKFSIECYQREMQENKQEFDRKYSEYAGEIQKMKNGISEVEREIAAL